MRAAVFIGAIAIMFLGIGVLTGAVGTDTIYHHDRDREIATYNMCVLHDGTLACIPIPESLMHFLNDRLSMPRIQYPPTPLEGHGNYYY